MPDATKETFITPIALRQSVADAARYMHGRGWTPATSSNFSTRIPGNAGLAISVSGLDKGSLTAQDFLEVPFTSSTTVNPQITDALSAFPTAVNSQITDSCAVSAPRPSAETPLHAMIYRQYPDVQTVLHSHSIDGTVLSKLYEAEGGIWLKNFELLKAFAGVKMHETRIWLPIFPNSQDMDNLAGRVSDVLVQVPESQKLYGFLLAGHGLYAWGNSTADALRHAETFEFLFTTVLKLRAYGYTDYS